MLIIARKLRELSFQRLMEVYRESNSWNGEAFYPDESPERQLSMAEDRFFRYLSEDFFTQRDARYYIWEENGTYVCAFRLWAFQDGYLLEGLETKPEERRKGYAFRLIRGMQERVPMGTRVYSHVSRRNKASRHLHDKCGFLEISETSRCLDGTVSSRTATLCWEKEDSSEIFPKKENYT